MRVSMLVFAAVIALPTPALAQDTKVTRAGQPVVVRVFYDCVKGRYPNAAGAASHGTVTSREARRNRCGSPNHPVVEAIYTPNPGFRGTDEVILYGGSRARVKVVVQ